jgi:hypothetical protein
VIARQSVWTDEKVVKLAEQFVPCADEVGRLQRGKDDDCLLFQKIAEQGHFKGRIDTTRQGIYCAAPSGVLLASVNNNNPEVIARLMERALKKWESMSREERLLPADAKYDPKFRWESRYPADGLVLKSIYRDAPREDVKPMWKNAWNTDFTWFRSDEAKGFMPKEIKEGATYEVPREQMLRLARFTLRDIVRGEAEPFAVKHVEKAALKGTITAIKDGIASIHFTGETRTSHEGEWSIEGLKSDKRVPQKRGYETKILGNAEYDVAAKKFKAFELVCMGPRWGGTRFNVRGGDLDPFPMIVVLQLGGNTPADHVAPAYMWDYGW